jgi:hypothetical protein
MSLRRGAGFGKVETWLADGCCCCSIIETDTPIASAVINVRLPHMYSFTNVYDFVIPLKRLKFDRVKTKTNAVYCCCVLQLYWRCLPLYRLTVDKKSKTYNRRDSQMVTHSSTSRPVQCLCMAERTGCPVFTDLWSYVILVITIKTIIKQINDRASTLPDG